MNFIHYLFETSFFLFLLGVLYQIYKSKEICFISFVLFFGFLGVFIISIVIPFDSQPHHLMIYSLLTIPFLFSLLIGIIFYMNNFKGGNIDVNL